MTLTHLLKRYEQLADRADQAFQKMQQDYPECIKCKPHCSDCCHALFGLFLIETAFLKSHFDRLGRKERRGSAAYPDSKKENPIPPLILMGSIKNSIRCPRNCWKGRGEEILKRHRS